MSVTREEIEALPGFLGWSVFGEESPSPSAARYANALLECLFAEQLAPKDEALLMKFLAENGPKDDSYLWDGSQKGWKLEERGLELRVLVRLDEPLGELGADHLEALKEALPEGGFNRLSTSQTDIALLFRDEDDARATRDALVAAGFDAEMTARRAYAIVREVGRRRKVVIVENEPDRERIVRRMIEAGVPVVPRTQAPR